MMITNLGTVIRTPVSQINTYSRTASGVIVMRLGEGQSLAGFSKVPHEEESPETVSENEQAVTAPSTEGAEK